MHLYTHEEVVAEVKPSKSRATVYFVCKTRILINTGEFSIVVKTLAFWVMHRMSCGALVSGMINELDVMQFHFRCFRMSFNFERRQL